MRAKPLVILCWVLVVLGVVFLGVHIYSLITRPALQVEFSRRDGRVLSVVAGGAAERAGILTGDRIISIGGEGVGEEVSPLFYRRAGERIPIIIERGGKRRTVDLKLVPLEQARREGLRGDFGRFLLAINSYLSIPLNIWMLSLGVALLVLRPDSKDARISALAFIFWATCSFFADAPGVGALLSSLPEWGRAAVYLMDAFFIAAFFAACVHFAIIFPIETTPRVNLTWEVLAWLLALPIMTEWALMGLRRVDASSPAARQGSDEIYLILGPALLCLALAIMAVRFSRERDLNSRRRLQLVFIALLPGVIGFIFSVVLLQIDASFAWRQVGQLVNLMGTFIGSGIYAYAVVRHRMYGIRVLVRRSLQYALARGTIAVLLSLPLIGLISFLYGRRRQPLDVLLTSMPAVYLLMLIPLVLVVIYRRRLLDALDRRYFREQYDARRVLLHVVSMVRGGSDMIGLSRVAIDEIDRALHPKHISLWHLDSEEKEFRRGFARGGEEKPMPPLPAFGALPALLATDDEPLDLYSRQTRTLVKRLPPGERDWLHETNAHLLVPLVIEQKLAGIMLLGERMSEEPYSPEDRELLRTLAAQLALTFDYSRLKSSPSVWSQPVVLPVVADELRSCPQCGRCFPSDQALCDFDRRPLIREEGVPRIIDDKYVINRILGRGGMGTVYLATQMRLNRPVAIKVLLGHLVGSASMRDRFEREARIVARLRHPAIVTIHDFGLLASGHAYLVMEYLQGETLRKVIFGGPIDVQKMTEIMKRAGEAIDSAHRAGVVHRDLKPENIMIVNDGNGAQSPRVLDFGLAKFTGPVSDDDITLVQSTQSVGVVGTLMYMAPELLNGFPADARSDQYSLALIAFELIAGTHPFASANNLASVVKGHTEGVVPPLENVPANVAEAIHRALSKEPADRFGSVVEFVEAMNLSSRA